MNKKYYNSKKRVIPNKAPDSRFDQAAADKAVLFIESLKLVKGEWAGKQFKLMNWQRKIIGDIFGTLKRNGTRQFNTALIFTPKKNAKSALASAVALYMLCCDSEYGSEVYGAAADKSQASIVFDSCAAIVEMSAELSKRLKVNRATKRIVYPLTNSFYQVVSADVPSKHGISASCVIFDELLAQKTPDFFRVMTTGTGDARRNPLTFVLSTAGTDKRSICYEQYTRAKQILAGERTDYSVYPVIYEAVREDDPSSPDTWRKANPSLGITITEDKMRQAWESALGNPVEEKLFKQLRLNIWSDDVAKWLPIEKWNSCLEEYEEEDFTGKTCFGGLDLSAKTDLTAFVLVFPPEKEGEPYKVLPYFWIPSDSVERHIRTDHIPYDKWQAEGHIMTTDGSVVHYDEIERFILRLSKKFKIKEIAMDDWNGQATAQHLEDKGLTMIQFRQGFRSMNEPTKELMNQILERNIFHNGNDVLTWNLESLIVKTDPAGNVKPDKAKSTQRIDGAVALIMALDRALKRSVESAESVYMRRGLIVMDDSGVEYDEYLPDGTSRHVRITDYGTFYS
ncbi:MAG: terminase large subunit [Clostridiales bacterium]|jgi:phage terminase large subunit-like protein|nr:terminase large subunit [Clostridiales bacterium]